LFGPLMQTGGDRRRRGHGAALEQGDKPYDLEEIVLQGHSDRLGPVRRAQLGKDATDVILDSRDADEQPLRDLGIG